MSCIQHSESNAALLLQPLRDNRIFRETGAGSFIRPLSPSYYRGKSFLSALINKYVEQPHGLDTPETVVLGSSNGAIQVEAVNLDKIRGKFSNFERLQEISLDKEGVSQADPPGEIRKRCPSQSHRRSMFPSDCLHLCPKMFEASTFRTALFQVGTSLP